MTGMSQRKIGLEKEFLFALDDISSGDVDPVNPRGLWIAPNNSDFSSFAFMSTLHWQNK